MRQTQANARHDMDTVLRAASPVVPHPGFGKRKPCPLMPGRDNPRNGHDVSKMPSDSKPFVSYKAPEQCRRSVYTYINAKTRVQADGFRFPV